MVAHIFLERICLLIMDNRKLNSELELLWNELKDVHLLIDLCTDGVYKREEIDIDVTESIMKCLSLLIERLLDKVSDIVCYLEGELNSKETSIPDRIQ